VDPVVAPPAGAAVARHVYPEQGNRPDREPVQHCRGGVAHDCTARKTRNGGVDPERMAEHRVLRRRADDIGAAPHGAQFAGAHQPADLVVGEAIGPQPGP